MLDVQSQHPAHDQVTVRRRQTGLTLLNRELSAGGYTLFAPQTGERGRLPRRHRRPSSRIGGSCPVRPGRDAVILKNGNLGYNGSHPTSLGLYPAWNLWHGGDFYEVTPDGEIVWRHEDPRHHHDAQWLDNGNLLYTAAEAMPKRDLRPHHRGRRKQGRRRRHRPERRRQGGRPEGRSRLGMARLGAPRSGRLPGSPDIRPPPLADDQRRVGDPRRAGADEPAHHLRHHRRRPQDRRGRVA